MNEKFNKNAKVDKFTSMLGMAVRLIVIDPLVPPQKPNFNTKINLKYHVTLSRKSQGQGHNSVEVIKVYKPTKHQVWTG